MSTCPHTLKQSHVHTCPHEHIQILKRLNRSHEAVLQFSWALDFSQTGSNSQLREEIDQAYLAHNPPGDHAMEDSDFAAYSDPDGPSEEVEGEGEMGDSVEGED